MSQISFDRLQADLPEYGAVWSALRIWFASNWRKRYVELSVLLRALGVDRVDALLAIQKMIEAGMLKAAYRVKAPGGYLLEDDFAEPDEIPSEMWDRDGSRKIPTADGDIVSGVKWEPADATA